MFKLTYHNIAYTGGKVPFDPNGTPIYFADRKAARKALFEVRTTHGILPSAFRLIEIQG